MLSGLLTLNLLFFAAQSILLRKLSTHRLGQELLAAASYCLGASLLAFLTLFALGKRVDAGGAGWAFLFGVLFALSITSYSYSLKIGPFSYTALFYSSSMVIPSLLGALLWGESMGLQDVAGILLILAAAAFISMEKDSPVRKGGKRWALFTALSFLMSGAASLAIKAGQMRSGGEDSAQFIALGFLAAGLTALALYACCGRGGNPTLGKDLAQAVGANGGALLGVALCTAAGNLIYSYLASRVAGFLLFPLLSGGNLLLVTLYSAVFRCERLGKRGGLGMLCGLAAVLLLSL